MVSARLVELAWVAGAISRRFKRLYVRPNIGGVFKALPQDQANWELYGEIAKRLRLDTS